MGSGRKHYVIIVMTKTGSSADAFCRRHLLPLDTESNPFLYNIDGKQYTCSDLDIEVEVFYTEDLNIRELQKSGKAEMHTVMIQGKGHSTSGGKPKNRDWEICNVSGQVAVYM